MVDVAKLEIQVDSKQVKGGTQDLATMTKGATAATGAFKLLGAAAAALGAGNILTKIANDTRAFSSSISELSAITGATGKNLDFLREQSLEIGRTTTLSASQAAEAFKLIASAKPDLLESGAALASVTKEAVKLAEAARVDLASAANTVGTSLNQFGAGAEEAARFVNVLAAGSKLGASSIEDTSLALKNSGAAAAAAGVGFEEANAAIQVLAAGGLKASEAGTGLRNIILKLEADTDQRLRPSVVGLGTALENLAAQNLTVTEVTKKFGMEGVVTASTLLKNADATSKLTSALTGTNIATEQAQTNFDNLDGDLLALNSSLESLSIELGSNAEPNMRKLVQALTDFSQKTIQFVKSDRFAQYLATTFNVAEKLAILLGVKLLANVISVGVAFARTATAAGVLGRAITLMGGPIGIITIAAFGLYEVLQKVANSRVDKMTESLNLAATQGVAAVTKHIDDLSSGLIEVQNQLKNAENSNKGLNATVSAGANQTIALRNREQEIIAALSEAEERRNMLVNAGKIATDNFADSSEAADKILEELSGTTVQYQDVMAETIDVNGLVESSTNKLSDKYKELTIELDRQKTQVGMTKREQYLYNQQLKLGADASLEERLAIESLAASLYDSEEAYATSTKAAKDAAEGQQIYKNMIENVQRSFGDLIYRTLDEGKLNFKSFFSSVLDGFKRLAAEIAAQKIMEGIFGSGGLDGFMSRIGGAFSGIVSSVASGFGGIVSSFSSSIMSVLASAGSAKAAQSAIAAGTSSMAANAAAAAGGTAAGGATVGGTLAAGAAKIGSTIATGASAVGSALMTAGSKALALATGPVGLTVLATAALAKVLDSGGTPTSTAGLTMAKTAGMSDANIFQTSPFASGFAPLGFKQNATNEQAEAAINPIRQLDASLTEIASGLGFNVDLSGHTFSGLGVEGTGAGTVLGTFVEKGNQKGTSLDKQLDNYASEWIKAVGVRNGVSEQVIKDVIGGGSASGILKTVAGLVDGSHQSGLSSVPYDGYIAELHAGERVQTSAQVAATDNMASEMVGLRNNLNELMLVVAKAVTKTARIEDRWDKNGLPPVRA
jgi:hypothetical protein